MSTFRCVVFNVGGHKFALPLACVERVVRAVEVTPLPDAPPAIMGIINVQGEVVPVVDARRQIADTLPVELDLNDQLVIARNGEKLIAIVANTVAGVAEFDRSDFAPIEPLPAVEGEDAQLHGVIATGDEIILVREPAHFLLEREQPDMTAAQEITATPESANVL